MRRLGHHVYTSLGGYRTVHCSPWLKDQLPWLVDRAQACYADTGGFDCLHRDGRWIATFVIGNGSDHVGRPRALVHTVVIDSRDCPPVFSPLFLRRACLEQLDHEDPALERRLTSDLDALRLREVMPSPSDFGPLLRGPAGSIVVAGYYAFAQARRPVELYVEERERALAELPAASCALFLHLFDCHLSTLIQPLTSSAGELPSLHILPRAQPSTSGLFNSAVLRSQEAAHFRAGRLLVDLIAESPQPPPLFFLLRQLPLEGLLREEPLGRLLDLQRRNLLRIDRDGTPRPDPEDAHAEQLLIALHGMGGGVLVQRLLAGWTEALQSANLDPEELDDLDAQILAATEPSTLSALCARLRTLLRSTRTQKR